jgi:chorismate mutase-like protein
MNTLETLRGEIDAIDAQLVTLVCKRLAICAEVGRLKKQLAISVMQPNRIVEVKNNAARIAAQYRVPRSLTDSLYDLIIGAACDIERSDVEQS